MNDYPSQTTENADVDVLISETLAKLLWHRDNPGIISDNPEAYSANMQSLYDEYYQRHTDNEFYSCDEVVLEATISFRQALDEIYYINTVSVN